MAGCGGVGGRGEGVEANGLGFWARVGRLWVFCVRLVWGGNGVGF